MEPFAILCSVGLHDFHTYFMDKFRDVPMESASKSWPLLDTHALLAAPPPPGKWPEPFAHSRAHDFETTRLNSA